MAHPIRNFHAFGQLMLRDDKANFLSPEISDPIAINERPYLSRRIRTSHGSVMAHSAFSTFTGTKNGSAGLTFSWRLRRAIELSNAKLALLTELPSLRAGGAF
ncbi:hypothetical protein AAC387_Pa06g3157 [Persea americana]